VMSKGRRGGIPIHPTLVNDGRILRDLCPGDAGNRLSSTFVCALG
jgi:hypothetical protein